jgi:glutamine synthetase
MTALPTSIRSLVGSDRVTELQLWFTDELGELEIVTIAGDELDAFTTRGVAHSDPSRSGCSIGYGADIVAVPDWHTFRLLPQTTHGPSAAAVFCCLESAGLVGLDDFVLQ